jgi:phosphonate transport system permease protein
MTSADLPAAAAADRRLRRRRIARWVLVGGAVTFVYVHAWQNTQVSVAEFFKSFGNMVRLVGEMLPPDWSVLGSAIHAGVLTFDTALLGTTAAFVVALVLTPLAARNITPHRLLYEGSRALIGLARTIPLWVGGLLFLVVVGPTPFAGVLALTLETIGVLPKLYAEAVEEMDMGPVDALRVAGARRTQIFIHGVLPAVGPTFVGLGVYRMDSNVRSALILSAFGAGGLGFLLFNSIELFQWAQVSTELIVLFALVLLVERVSILVRARLS